MCRDEQVLDPKVRGAMLLHKHTLKDPLRFFIVFSSISSVLGAAFQANYAAANSYLEGLVRHRRRMKLPGFCLQMSPISDVGVVSRDKFLLMKMSGNVPVMMVTPHQIIAIMFSALASDGNLKEGFSLWLPHTSKQSIAMQLTKAEQGELVHTDDDVVICAAVNWKVVSKDFFWQEKASKFNEVMEKARSRKGDMLPGGGSEVRKEYKY